MSTQIIASYSRISFAVFNKYKNINEYANRQNVDKEKEKLLLLALEKTAREISNSIIASNTIEVVTDK